MKARRLPSGSALLACLGLYALVVLGSPGLHHDFDCHVKSPRHCQACAANPLAPRASASSACTGLTLLDLGRNEPPPDLAPPRGITPHVSGRAPPR